MENGTKKDVFHTILSYYLFVAGKRNPSTPPELLITLAMSDQVIAEIIAARVDLPAELLARLAQHPNRAVRDKARANPRTPRGAFDRHY